MIGENYVSSLLFYMKILGMFRKRSVACSIVSTVLLGSATIGILLFKFVAGLFSICCWGYYSLGAVECDLKFKTFCNLGFRFSLVVDWILICFFLLSIIIYISSASILLVSFRHSLHSSWEYIALPFIRGWYRYILLNMSSSESWNP